MRGRDAVDLLFAPNCVDDRLGQASVGYRVGDGRQQFDASRRSKQLAELASALDCYDRVAKTAERRREIPRLALGNRLSEKPEICSSVDGENDPAFLLIGPAQIMERRRSEAIGNLGRR